MRAISIDVSLMVDLPNSLRVSRLLGSRKVSMPDNGSYDRITALLLSVPLMTVTAKCDWLALTVLPKLLTIKALTVII